MTEAALVREGLLPEATARRKTKKPEYRLPDKRITILALRKLKGEQAAYMVWMQICYLMALKRGPVLANNSTLGLYLGMHRNTVQKSIVLLESMGFIQCFYKTEADALGRIVDKKRKITILWANLYNQFNEMYPKSKEDREIVTSVTIKEPIKMNPVTINDVYYKHSVGDTIEIQLPQRESGQYTIIAQNEHFVVFKAPNCESKYNFQWKEIHESFRPSRISPKEQEQIANRELYFKALDACSPMLEWADQKDLDRWVKMVLVNAHKTFVKTYNCDKTTASKELLQDVTKDGFMKAVIRKAEAEGALV